MELKSSLFFTPMVISGTKTLTRGAKSPRKEETKSISVAHNGRLVRYSASGSDVRSSLLRWVRKAMPEKKTASDQSVDWFKSRIARLTKGRNK